MNTSTKSVTGHASPRVHPSPTPPTSTAQKRAALMLEVLAGLRSAPQAAAALQISVNHYYLLERQALQGLVAACEPRPKGQRTDPQRQVHALEQALARSRQECQRQAALVRATQRAMGLPAVPSPEPATGKSRRSPDGKSGSRKRASTVRALRLARRLASVTPAPDAAPASSPIVSASDTSLSFPQESSDAPCRT